VAVVALFAALVGGAYAAKTLKKNSVVTKSIKKGSVTTPKIRPGAITSAKIFDGSITSTDLASGTIGLDKFAPGLLPARTAGGLITGASQTRGLTVGNWTVEVNTDASGICESLDVRAGAKPGSAGALGSSPVAPGGTSPPIVLPAVAGVGVGGVTDDGTSSFSGSVTYAGVGGNSCSYVIAMTGN
jgi:hypothetical protein